MPSYEHVFLARQDLSTAQVDSLAETFTKIIEDGAGKVAKTEYWGLKSLAYRIKKNRKAHYVLLNIEAPAPAVHEMERNIAINEDVIRYQTIRVDELEKEWLVKTERAAVTHSTAEYATQDVTAAFV